MNKYKDIFIDFDDTLYDTRGNAIIALKELYESMDFRSYGVDEERFYDIYWTVNIDLWGRYAKGEITRDYLIVERFRKPLAEARIALHTAGNISDTVTSPAAEDSLSNEEGSSPNKDGRLSNEKGSYPNKDGRLSNEEGSWPDEEGSWPDEEYCYKVNDAFINLCFCKPGTVDGAHELIEYLHSKGYRLHICSNGFHEVQYKKLQSCGLTSYFDTVILSEDAGANKPNPAFFDYAMKVSGADRETTLMIGDNYYSDIVGALDSGIDAMLFQRWDPTFEPPRKVNYIVDTLKEIMTIL